MSDAAPFEDCEPGTELLVRYACTNRSCSEHEEHFDVWVTVVNAGTATISDGSDRRCPVCRHAGSLVRESTREGYFS